MQSASRQLSQGLSGPARTQKETGGMKDHEKA
jgi:hypothetical protein